MYFPFVDEVLGSAHLVTSRHLLSWGPSAFLFRCFVCNLYSSFLFQLYHHIFLTALLYCTFIRDPSIDFTFHFLNPMATFDKEFIVRFVPNLTFIMWRFKINYYSFSCPTNVWMHFCIYYFQIVEFSTWWVMPIKREELYIFSFFSSLASTARIAILLAMYTF